MAYPEFEGTYVASIGLHVMDIVKDKAVFKCQYMLESLDGYADVQCAGQYLEGTHFIQKTGGELNSFTVDALKAAFGWDGINELWLEDSDFAGLKVRVVAVKPGEYWEIAYVNPLVGGGGGSKLEKSDQSLRQRISSSLGPRLRAAGGGGTGAAPRTAPAAPAQQSPPVPQVTGTVVSGPTAPSPPAAEVQADANSCWTQICKKMHGKQQTEINDKWIEMLDGRMADQMTPVEWTTFSLAIDVLVVA